MQNAVVARVWTLATRVEDEDACMWSRGGLAARVEEKLGRHLARPLERLDRVRGQILVVPQKAHLPVRVRVRVMLE